MLIRHGDNEYTSQGKLAGWTPGVHLNQKGKEQAAKLAEYLDLTRIAAIYSSPLLRTIQTAKPLAKAKGLTIRKCSGVAEVRYGSWQGQTLKTLRRRKLWHTVQHRPSAAAFPNGETIRHVQIRAVDAIEKVSALHTKYTVVVFSHADVIKMILAHYLGMPLDLYHRILIGTASISDLILNIGKPMVIGTNRTLEEQRGRSIWDHA